MRPAGLLSMSTSKKTLGLARAKFEVENFEVVCLMSLNIVLFLFFFEFEGSSARRESEKKTKQTIFGAIVKIPNYPECEAKLI